MYSKNKQTNKLVAGCFLLVISTILVYFIFEIKYLYIFSKKGYSDFCAMLVSDVLADGEKGFIRVKLEARPRIPKRQLR